MKTEDDYDTPTITQRELFWRGVACALVGIGLYTGDAYFHRSTNSYFDVGRLADVATVLVAVSAVWTVVFDVKLFKWFMRRVRRLYIEIKAYAEQVRQSGDEKPEATEQPEAARSPMGNVKTQAVKIRPAEKSPPLKVFSMPIGASDLVGAEDKNGKAASFGIAMILVVIVGVLVLPPMCTSSTTKPDSAKSGEGKIIVTVPGVEVVPQRSEEKSPLTLPEDQGATEPTIEACSYLVQPGDNCWKIAASYGVEPYPAWLDIARLNDIRSPQDGNDCPIEAGTKLTLPNNWCQ
jgi:hypothetical protein